MKGEHIRHARAGLAAALAGFWLMLGDPASAETLSEAVAFAYESHPALIARRAEVRALDEGYVQARASMGPTVEVSAATSQRYNRNQTLFGTLGESRGETADSALSLAQPLFTSGRVAAGVRAAYADIEAGRETLRRTEVEVLLDVITAYVVVLRDQRAVAAAEENRALLQQQLADTESRYNAREATATDRAQAQSRLAGALGDLAEARGQLEASRATYLAVVGRNPGDLASEPSLTGIPATLDEALAIAERNSPVLGAALKREESAEAGRDAALAQFLPDVSFRVDALERPVTAFANDRRESDLTGRLVVRQTLFSAGANSSRARESTERTRQAHASADGARREVRQGVARAWALAAGFGVSVTRNQERVASLRVALEGARLEERMGVRTTLEVLNQAQELQLAQQALVRSQADEYLARANLLGQMGLLTVDRFAPELSPYDPRNAFDRVRNRGGAPWTPALIAVDGLVQPARRLDAAPDPAAGASPLVGQTLSREP